MMRAFWIGLLLSGSPSLAAGAPSNGAQAKTFLADAQIVSRPATEQYAHQSYLCIVKGIGYAVYQANDTTPEESKAGEVVRMAVFDIHNPAATAKWVDVGVPEESSGGITLTGKAAADGNLTQIDDDTLRIFFGSKIEGDLAPTSRLLYKDYTISTGTLSELRQVRCTVAKQPGTKLDLAQEAVQRHLDFLFGPGTGAQYGKGISFSCNLLNFDGQLYGAVQIKRSEGGKTQLMTNVLMRSADHGATWELLGAPDPHLLPSPGVQLLAEPAMSQDAKYVYFQLRSNVVENGYQLCKADKADLYKFDAPVKKWTFGIGRPSVCDFGDPVGVVAMFTAPTVHTGANTFSRNVCDVVRIDPSYSAYTLAFSIMDPDAVNTPFMCPYDGDVYVTYSTGHRHLLPKFGTSEIVFSRLRKEFFAEKN